MSKILKNNTASIVPITDVGQNVPASGQITISAIDYLLFAASSDVITLIGDSTLTVNDGSTDLSISDGTDLIKGIFPTTIDANVTASVLPTGSSTSSNQTTGNNSLSSIDSKVATATKQDTIISSLATIDTSLDDNATAANQTTGNASLSSIDGKVSTAAKQDTQITEVQSSNTKLDTIIAKDFATSAKQDTGNTSLGSIDTKLTNGNQQTKIKGDTNGTLIGNVGDALKVHQDNETTISDQNTDLFDRVSVAEDSPLWSFSHRYDDDNDLYWDIDAPTGTGTVTINETTVSAEMVNSLGASDRITYSTHRYFEYSKGRQQSFFFTCNPQDLQTNVVKQFGAFDDKNGLFFELTGTTARFCRRTNTSGSVVNNYIDQTAWTDPMDGTGVSGMTMDWGKFNLFYITFAWLGGNAVEFGIFNGGRKVPFHRLSFANMIETAYSQSGNLPFGFTIENDGVPSSAPEFYAGCMAVFNNGLQSSLGEVFFVDTGTSETTVNTTAKVIAAIRMNPSKNRASIKPLTFSLFSSSGNSSIYYQVKIGGTFVGDTWAGVPKSIAQGLTGHTSYSGGFTLQSGYVKAGGESVQILTIESDLYLGRHFDGTSQVLVIEAQTISSNAKLLFAGSYREYK